MSDLDQLLNFQVQQTAGPGVFVRCAGASWPQIADAADGAFLKPSPGDVGIVPTLTLKRFLPRQLRRRGLPQPMRPRTQPRRPGHPASGNATHLDAALALT